MTNEKVDMVVNDKFSADFISNFMAYFKYCSIDSLNSFILSVRFKATGTSAKSKRWYECKLNLLEVLNNYKSRFDWYMLETVQFCLPKYTLNNVRSRTGCAVYCPSRRSSQQSVDSSPFSKHLFMIQETTNKLTYTDI